MPFVVLQQRWKAGSRPLPSSSFPTPLSFLPPPPPSSSPLLHSHGKPTQSHHGPDPGDESRLRVSAHSPCTLPDLPSPRSGRAVPHAWAHTLSSHLLRPPMPLIYLSSRSQLLSALISRPSAFPSALFPHRPAFMSLTISVGCDGSSVCATSVPVLCGSH